MRGGHFECAFIYPMRMRVRYLLPCNQRETIRVEYFIIPYTTQVALYTVSLSLVTRFVGDEFDFGNRFQPAAVFFSR